jgi:hypothetical protein
VSKKINKNLWSMNIMEQVIVKECETCGGEYEPGDARYCCYGCFIIAGEEKDVK